MPPIIIFQDESATPASSSTHSVAQAAQQQQKDPDQFSTHEFDGDKILRLCLGIFIKPKSIYINKPVYGILKIKSEGQDVINPNLIFRVEGSGYRVDLAETEENFNYLELDDPFGAFEDFEELRAVVTGKLCVRYELCVQYFHILQRLSESLPHDSPAGQGLTDFVSSSSSQQGIEPLQESSNANANEQVQQSSQATDNKPEQVCQDKENHPTENSFGLERDELVGQSPGGNSVSEVQAIEQTNSPNLSEPNTVISVGYSQATTHGDNFIASQSPSIVSARGNNVSQAPEFDVQGKAALALAEIERTIGSANLGELLHRLQSIRGMNIIDDDEEEDDMLVPYHIFYGNSRAPDGELQDVWIQMSLPKSPTGSLEIRFPMLGAAGSTVGYLDGANVYNATQKFGNAFVDIISTKKIIAVAKYFFFKIIHQHKLMVGVKMHRDIPLGNSFLTDLFSACLDHKRGQTDAQRAVVEAPYRPGVAWITGDGTYSYFGPARSLPLNELSTGNLMLFDEEANDEEGTAQQVARVGSSSSQAADNTVHLHEVSISSRETTLVELPEAQTQQQQVIEVDNHDNDSTVELSIDRDHDMPNVNQRSRINQVTLRRPGFPDGAPSQELRTILSMDQEHTAVAPTTGSPVYFSTDTTSNQLGPVIQSWKLVELIARRYVLRDKTIKNMNEANVLQKDRFLLYVEQEEFRIRDNLIRMEQEQIQRETEQLDREIDNLSNGERMVYNSYV